MNTSFFSFIEKLESLAFFSGYPLVYILIHVLIGKKTYNIFHPKTILIKSLPIAYALTATLFIGLQIRNLYPDFSIATIRSFFNCHWSRIWGLTAILFWLPSLNKKSLWCLLHSIVFFLLLIADFFKGNNDVIKNNMKVYTASIMLNATTLFSVFIIYMAYTRIKAQQQPPVL